MTQYIYLQGSEQVQNAANSMARSAETMNAAANNLGSYLEAHQRFMQQWLEDLRALLEEHKRGSL